MRPVIIITRRRYRRCFCSAGAGSTRGKAGHTSRIDLVRVVRPAVIGHPVERIFQIVGHGGAEPDDKDLITCISEVLGSGDSIPPVFVSPTGTFRSVTAAGIG